jgi:hypothetical protein
LTTNQIVAFGLDITNNGVEQKFTPTLPKAWDRLILKGVGGSESEFVIEYILI